MKKVISSIAIVSTILLILVILTGCPPSLPSSSNTAPNTPRNPNPSDNAQGMGINTTLSWECSDPDGDDLTYDIYFGTSSNPPLKKAGYTSKSYNPGTLSYNTKYYWKIVAKDSEGEVTEGPFWNFTTKSIDISFTKCLGGSNGERARSIQQTKDGGYIVAGVTLSNDGDVSGNHGKSDYWIVKLDEMGNIQWQKCLGGYLYDEARSIQQTSDGGYIVTGDTESNDGDVSGNHGMSDYWVVKLDETGNIQWQKCLGGSDDDYAYSIQQTKDGGYIVAGYTYSTDGDVSGNHGAWDSWIVKLDETGNMQWQKCLGGSSSDETYSIQQTTDGGYIVAGDTWSNDGDVSGNHGYIDYWIVKLDETGEIEWQKCLGGSYDDYAYSIQQTSDGGYIVAGDTESTDGDVSGNHGSWDYWIVKLDETGNIQWQKCLGGSDEDSAESIQQTSDGGYIVAGDTKSNNGDVSGFHGGYDCWIVILDETGNIQWQKCLGGSDWDFGNSIQQTSDGGYIVAGSTASNDGDVSGNHGGDWPLDCWIVKLEAE